MKFFYFRLYFNFLLVMLFPCKSFAEENILGKIKQINTEKKSAAIAITAGSVLAVGDILVVPTSDLKQCELRVEEISSTDNIAIASTSTCSNAADIKIGTGVEKSLLSTKDFRIANGAEPAKITEPEKSDIPWRFGMGLSYSTNAKLAFDTITVSSGASILSADLNYKNTFSLEFDVRKMKSYSWGFIGGLTYDGARKFSGGSISGSGVTLAVTPENPSKIQTTVIYANAAYQWDSFYLPFGINYNFVKYTPPSTFNGTYDIAGSIGAQLGLGYYINSNFVAELCSRVVSANMKETEKGTTVDYGFGMLSSMQITAKYFFK